MKQDYVYKTKGYTPRSRPRGRPERAYKEREVLNGDTIHVRRTGSNHKILRFHHRLNGIDPKTLSDDSFTHSRKRRHVKKYGKILDREDRLLNSATDIERDDAEFEAKQYMYQILSYAKEDNLTPEELKKAKLFHYFSTKGVRNGYAASANRRLLSADIFYILLSEVPVARLAKIFNVPPSVVSLIKTGKMYPYEHSLVQSIRSIVNKNLRRLRPNGEDKVKRSIFRLVKMNEAGDSYEILYHAKSKQVACGIRKTIIKEDEFDKLKKKGLLDIKYPIQEIILL